MTRSNEPPEAAERLTRDLAVTPGEFYCACTLVRVVGPDFVAGMLLDPATQRIAFAAPILRHLVGHKREKLRQTFARLGWRATIVRRAFNIDEIHAERLARLHQRDLEARVDAEVHVPVPLKEKPRPPARRRPRSRGLATRISAS